MKKLALLVLVCGLTACASNSPYNPFICNKESDTLMQNTLSTKYIDPAVITGGLYIGTVQANASTFLINADIFNMITKATDKIQADDVLIVNTDIDACNQTQYLYAKYLISQVAAKGIKTDRVLFVDKKTNQLLKADKSMTITMDFVIVKRSQLNIDSDLF